MGDPDNVNWLKERALIDVAPRYLHDQRWEPEDGYPPDIDETRLEQTLQAELMLLRNHSHAVRRARRTYTR